MLAPALDAAFDAARAEDAVLAHALAENAECALGDAHQDRPKFAQYIDARTGAAEEPRMMECILRTYPNRVVRITVLRKPTPA